MKRKIVTVSIILVFMLSIISNLGIKHAEAKGNGEMIKNELLQSIEQTNKLITGNQKNAVPTNIVENEDEKLIGPRVENVTDAIISGTLMEYPNIIKINETTGESSGKVSGAYANLLMFSAKSKYTVVGAKSTTTTKTIFNETTTEATGGEHYVKISNVGFYQGKIIDLKINFESVNGTGQFTVWTPTKVGSSDFLRMQVKGKDQLLKIRYDFLDNETGEKVPYKGSWIVKRLNDYKTLRIDSTPEALAGIFAYDTKNVIEFTTDNDFATSDFVGTNANTGIELKKNQMMYSFNAPSGSLVQEYFPRGTGDRNVYYESESIVEMELPYPNLFGETNEAHPKVSYYVQQDYPAQAKAQFYPTSYMVTAKLDKVVDMKKLKLTVTDLSGTDVTNNFTLSKIEGSNIAQITINPSALNSEAFANNSYKMHLESEMDSTVSPDEYYEEDGYYHIPASITMKSSTNESPVQTDEALTKAPKKGEVTAKYVLEDEKTEIADAVTQTDVVGKDYTVEQKEIEGYEFVKSIGNTVGKFTENPQTILLVYKKIPPKTGKVTAKYVLEDEKTEIADAISQTGELGKPYTIEQKEIKGYTFVKSVGETTGNYEESEKTVLMVYKKEVLKGKVTARYVIENQAVEIAEPDVKTGEVGDNYLFTPKEIEGYEFVQSFGDVSGQFKEEEQTVLFMYREVQKNAAPKITLDQESTEPINNTGEDFTLSGQVSDEDSDEVTAYYKVDSGEAKEIETFKQSSEKNKVFDYNTVISNELLNDGQEHTITVFAKDSEGQKSLEEPKVMLRAFKGTLQFVEAPNAISFGGNLKISSKSKNYFVQSKTNDLIVQDKRVNPEGWRMSASLENPLTSESGAIIENAVLYDNKIIQEGNAIVIFEQQQETNEVINLSKDWIEKEQGLNLAIPARKAKPESYTTEIIWSLESVPRNG